jgi:hypothetical protein
MKMANKAIESTLVGRPLFLETCMKKPISLIAALIAVTAPGASAAPVSLALSPAGPWHKRIPSALDIERLNEAACVQPHATKLENLELGSRLEDPAAQLTDLSGAITCSPHEIKDAIIWRHVAFCYWRTSLWSCEDKRTIAEFSVRGRTFKIDFYNGSFPATDVRRIAGDIFGLGATGPGSIEAPAGDSCFLERGRTESFVSGEKELEYTSLVCTSKIIGIEEKCENEQCQYVATYSFEK